MRKFLTNETLLLKYGLCQQLVMDWEKYAAKTPQIFPQQNIWQISQFMCAIHLVQGICAGWSFFSLGCVSVNRLVYWIGLTSNEVFESHTLNRWGLRKSYIDNGIYTVLNYNKFFLCK